MGFSIFPEPTSAAGTSNLTTSDLTTYSAALTRLTKRSTYNGTTNGITYPAGVNFVYALVIGGGGGGQGAGGSRYSNSGGTGRAGGLSFGLSKTASSAIVGAGGNGGYWGNSESQNAGNSGGASFYGSISAGGGPAQYYGYYNQQTTRGRGAVQSIISDSSVPFFGYSFGSNTPSNFIEAGENYSTNFYNADRGGSGPNDASASYNFSNAGFLDRAVGRPTGQGYSGGNGAGGTQVSTNVYNFVTSGGSAGYTGSGTNANQYAPGSGGAGGGGGGTTSSANQTTYDNQNGGRGGASINVQGGNGGAGVVELYY